MTTTIVSALYANFEQAKRAVENLESSSVPADNISIIASNGEKKYDSYAKDVANDAGTGAGLGGAVGAGAGLLAGLGLMAIPGVGPVVAAGWLASTLAGAVAGGAVGAAAGGVIGSLTESGLSEEDAQLYAEHIRRGGAMVCARVDSEDAYETQGILNATALNPTTQSDLYAAEGWTPTTTRTTRTTTTTTSSNR
jgi:hypothetical protein